MSWTIVNLRLQGFDKTESGEQGPQRDSGRQLSLDPGWTAPIRARAQAPELKV